MKQHPILFSTPMVQAILQGVKTQTRRIVKPQPIGEKLQWPTIYSQRTLTEPDMIKKCPYGRVGEILWVRETWSNKFSIKGEHIPEQYVYLSTDARHEGNMTHNELGLKWKPSIHMPKAACRIWLQVTDIRVERLQQITDEDAIAEGIVNYAYGYWKNYSLSFSGGRPTEGDFKNPKESYQSLWEKINGKDSWNVNPWVWVVEFQKIEKP